MEAIKPQIRVTRWAGGGFAGLVTNADDSSDVELTRRNEKTPHDPTRVALPTIPTVEAEVEAP